VIRRDNAVSVLYHLVGCSVWRYASGVNKQSVDARPGLATGCIRSQQADEPRTSPESMCPDCGSNAAGPSVAQSGLGSEGLR
jgi:hypothetical protein